MDACFIRNGFKSSWSQERTQRCVQRKRLRCKYGVLEKKKQSELSTPAWQERLDDECSASRVFAWRVTADIAIMLGPTILYLPTKVIMP